MHALTSGAIWLVILAQGPSAPATAVPAEPAAPAREEATERFQAEAKRYVLQPAGDGAQKLELVAEPLLHWGNPARNSEDGAVFVWTKAGRPEAVGSIFTFTHGT